MASLNQVTLIGNVGKDPEIRNTQSGLKIVNLTIATSERWKDKASGENKEKTEWHRVVVMNDRLAGMIERFVTKGSKLYIVGKLQTRKWTDQSGAEKYSTEILLGQYGGEILLLDSKNTNPDAERSPARPAAARVGTQAADYNDEIPF